MSTGDVAITMFERIGGQATIDRLVDRFYDRMETLPVFKGVFTRVGALQVSVRKRGRRYQHQDRGGYRRCGRSSKRLHWLGGWLLWREPL